MLRTGSGMVGLVLTVIRTRLRPKLKNGELVQNPNLVLKINLFGNLIEELNHWHLCCDDEARYGEEDELQYCEDKFVETLEAVRDMRALLLSDLEEYVRLCKEDNEPVDLGLYRVKKQLDESTFELIRK
jgi:hypothetical protein